MLWNPKVDLLHVCRNLKRKRFCASQHCAVDHLNKVDLILKSLRVRMSAKHSEKLARILSPAKQYHPGEEFANVIIYRIIYVRKRSIDKVGF